MIVIGPHVLELQVARNTFVGVNMAELKAHLIRPQGLKAHVERAPQGVQSHEQDQTGAVRIR